MSQVKYTKTELRSQQQRMSQLTRYLPTLQLKKGMLQLEVDLTQSKLHELVTEKNHIFQRLDEMSFIFSQKEAWPLFEAIEIEQVKTHFENIAGVDVPVFEDVAFKQVTYSLFLTPFWLEDGVQIFKTALILREKVKVLREKLQRLQKELKEVSIRVNLFEKILIPRTWENIKKIKIFLSDQQLAAVSQSKMAKKKILMRKQLAR